MKEVHIPLEENDYGGDNTPITEIEMIGIESGPL
jgi:hypothetical protein